MKNISTGFGLCVLGLGIAAWPVLDRLMPTANASAVTAAAAVTTAATGQTAPTIVWYGSMAQSVAAAAGGGRDIRSMGFWLLRAWSDGRVEARWIGTATSSGIGDGESALATCISSVGMPTVCKGPWIVIADPAEGYAFRSDLIVDELVDGADLAALLADWGNAPRQDIPPSDCPLALINP